MYSYLSYFFKINVRELLSFSRIQNQVAKSSIISFVIKVNDDKDNYKSSSSSRNDDNNNNLTDTNSYAIATSTTTTSTINSDHHQNDIHIENDNYHQLHHDNLYHHDKDVYNIRYQVHHLVFNFRNVSEHSF